MFPFPNRALVLFRWRTGAEHVFCRRPERVRNILSTSLYPRDLPVELAGTLHAFVLLFKLLE